MSVTFSSVMRVFLQKEREAAIMVKWEGKLD